MPLTQPQIHRRSLAVVNVLVNFPKLQNLISTKQGLLNKHKYLYKKLKNVCEHRDRIVEIHICSHPDLPYNIQKCLYKKCLMVHSPKVFPD